MKTVFIVDNIGEEPIMFRVMDGDYRYLNNKYGNCMDTTDSEQDQINEVMFDENFYTHPDLTMEFPTQAVIDGAFVVVVGFIP